MILVGNMDSLSKVGEERIARLFFWEPLAHRLHISLTTVELSHPEAFQRPSGTGPELGQLGDWKVLAAKLAALSLVIVATGSQTHRRWIKLKHKRPRRSVAEPAP